MSRIRPELLEPYLGLPSEAADLTLLTGILNATPNWLVFRYLHSLLKPSSSSSSSVPRGTASTQGGQHQQAAGRDDDDEPEEPPAVCLVSFLRDFAFYQEGLGKLGVDLEACGRKKGNFVFADGLSSLFLPPPPLPPSGQQQQQQQQQQQWKKTMVGSRTEDIRRVILEGIATLKTGTAAGNQQGKKVVLVLDGLGLLLLASALDDGGAGAGTDVNRVEVMRNLLMELRQNVYSTIVTLQADEPLIVDPLTTLETDHSHFVRTVTHQADTVVSLTPLGTGAARDVNGVLRIVHDRKRPEAADDREYLYHVGGDGGVRVFERGQ
ncbi:Elongator complex protein 6 [Podospora australis]|uniref:Elongator complex protein 6 n=1 Tax=Podospora australis TaxID=1536484 RepID=A0AAN6WWY1_9PEZI|nr:Elongator complex protein 6 [Podospora australis]